MGLNRGAKGFITTLFILRIFKNLKKKKGGILTWSNQHDQMNMTKIGWTWPKNQQQTLTIIEHDRKFNKIYQQWRTLMSEYDWN